MPVQLPGVIGVASEGRNGMRVTTNPPGASNFGAGVIDVVAPGGDPAQGRVPTGLVLSTFPSYIPVPPTAMPNVVDGPSGATFRYNAGTSMAAAQVSGVAALIVSRYGTMMSPGNGKMAPAEVAMILRQSSDPLACPAAPTTCTGLPGDNSFFGAGRVNAFRAVTS